MSMLRQRKREQIAEPAARPFAARSDKFTRNAFFAIVSGRIVFEEMHAFDQRVGGDDESSAAALAHHRQPQRTGVRQPRRSPDDIAQALKMTFVQILFPLPESLLPGHSEECREKPRHLFAHQAANSLDQLRL